MIDDIPGVRSIVDIRKLLDPAQKAIEAAGYQLAKLYVLRHELTEEDQLRLIYLITMVNKLEDGLADTTEEEDIGASELYQKWKLESKGLLIQH